MRGILFGLGLGLSLGVFGLAQAQVMPHQSKHKSLGTVNCASSTCHGSIEERSSTPVLQNEYTTWLRQDPHTQAYRILLNEDSKRIAKNLGLKKPAHESKECLDCHSHNAPTTQRGERFDVTDGVSCEGCHGPAGDWVKTHIEPKPSHTKNIQNGMYPTNEPYAVAKLCTSCHQGDATRPITHQIMGAGHPRLAIEVDTFLALEPPHYRIDKDWTERKGTFDSGKIWAMGQIAAASNLMSLIADPKRNRQGLMPEFMMFDCHSCHSPMSKKDWQPALGATPGQARINDSSLAMVSALVKATQPQKSAQLKADIQALHVASTSATANQDQLTKAANKVNATLTDVRNGLSAIKMDGPILQKVLKEIVITASSGQYHDFAQAEQAFMSVSSVANSLGQRGDSTMVQNLNKRLNSLHKVLANDEQYDRTAFQNGMAGLKQVLGE
jgi:hypothetical protein